MCGKYSFRKSALGNLKRRNQFLDRLTRKENTKLDLTDTGYEDSHCFRVGQLWTNVGLL